jgi:hypothetical protein
MCEYLEYEVTSLVRKRIMHIDLKGLSSGQYRHLSAQEMQHMNAALANSSKVVSDNVNKQISKTPSVNGQNKFTFKPRRK